MTDAINAALARCEALAEPQGLCVSFRYRGRFRDWGASYSPYALTGDSFVAEHTSRDLVTALGLVERALAVRAERPEKGARDGSRT